MFTVSFIVKKSIVLSLAIVFCLSVSFPSLPSGATGNLEHRDFVGIWISDWVAIAGERQELIIHPNLSIEFIREFNDSRSVTMLSNDATIIDDVLIISFKNENDTLVYRLVLSGWKSKNVRKLYGTMYLYDDGVQFNGLPLSFKLMDQVVR